MICDGCSKDLARLPSNAKEVRLLFDSEVLIAPDVVMTVMTRPRVFFQPRSVVIVENHSSFVIQSFLIGVNSQYWANDQLEEIPGQFFQPMAYPILCMYDKAHISADIAFEVKNITKRPTRFFAFLSGFELT